MATGKRQKRATPRRAGDGGRLNRSRVLDGIIDRHASTRTRRYDLEILQSLRRIIRAVDLHSRRLKAAFELTAPQLVCLLTVAEEGPISLSFVALRMHLSPSTVVGILDRLEARGLVERTRDQQDRRVVRVTATTKGRRLARRAPSPLHDNLADSLARLPRRDQASIASALGRIVELMEARSLDAAPILKTGKIQD